MTELLLTSAVVIFACVVFQRLSGKFGVPGLFVFILLGMLFGSDGLFKISFDDFGFANEICSVALVFIMFYGGAGTRWDTAKPVAVKSMLLSSVGTFVTCGLAGDIYSGIELSELKVSRSDRYEGKTIAESFKGKRLVIFIKRGTRVLFPSGDTVLEAGDTLIINETDYVTK